MKKIENIFSIQNKVIVITGASGYLFNSTANNLLYNGAKVVYLDKNLSKIKRYLKKMDPKGNRLSILPVRNDIAKILLEKI